MEERTSNQSEVAQLMAQIDSEISAMRQAMTGFASLARHEIIRQRFGGLDTCFRQLSLCIGEQRALEAIVQKMEEL
jgi:hypothetical protein